MNGSRRTAFVLFALAISASSVRAGYAPGCTVALALENPLALAHQANAVAIQPDGKIVVAGYADLGAGAGRDFLVARLHPDLSFDTSFNSPKGYLVHSLQNLDDEAFAVVVQFDQKIVVGGYSQDSINKYFFAFARYNRDGSLDTTFAAPSGFTRIDLFPSNNDRLRGMAIQPDGKILGAGFSTPGGTQRLVVVRLQKDGSLDDSFDGNGTALPTIGGSAFSFGTGVVVQPDGKIVVSGEAFGTSSDFIAVRLLPDDGSLDGSFDGDGWVATDIGGGTGDSASSLVLQSDGKIVLAGTTGANAAVARYREDGTLDGTFGSGGKVVHDFGGSDTGNALTLDSGGNLLVAGTSSLNFAFARFLQPDGFNNLSKTDDVSGMEDRAFGIAVTRTGKILVVGSSQPPPTNTNKATLALYKADGSQDCSYLVNPVDVFTAGSSGDSTNGQVMLNWLNPSYGPYDRTVIQRDTTACPGTPTDGDPVATQSNGLGNPGGFVDTPPLGPTYFYAAFVLDSINQPSTRVCKSATPFDRNAPASKVEWLYDTSGSALTTPGLRVNRSPDESVVYTVASVANDHLVHAIRGGPAGAAIGGGSWPLGWRPLRIGGAVQARPPVVPLPAPWSTRAVLLGSQDGRAYAIDALTGALIWRSAVLGTFIQAGPAAVLTALGGTADLVFVATRNLPLQANHIYALDATDGAVAWDFDNGGDPTGIGTIVSGASVDYGTQVDSATQKVYFTSALGTSLKTTWCLNYSVTTRAMCSGWPDFGVRPGGGGDIEASPILFRDLLFKDWLFVSDTLPGDLRQINPADGSDSLVFPLANGGAKGFVFPQFGTSNLFASTLTSTYSVFFNASPPPPPGVNWTGGCVATPSTPTAVRGTDWVFVGSSEGKLFQYSAASGGGGCPASRSACIGDCTTTIVGAPAYDVLRTMLYAGTDEGKIYGVRAPFQP